MRKTFWACALTAAAALAAAVPARAEHAGTVGLGVIAGSPFGVTGKYFFNEAISADAGVGYGNAGVFYGDLQYNWWGAQQPSNGQLDIYAGVGPRVATDDGGQFSARTVAGVGYWPSGHPVELFAEFGPAWKISPSDERVDLDGGVGLRYYFTMSVARANP